jgi:hypothetical protein
MAWRLWAFVLVMVVIGGPIAAGVCEARCAAASQSALPGHADHHSCAPLGTNVGIAVNAVPHACGHSSDDTVGVPQALQLLTAPALIVRPRSLFPPVETATVAEHTRDIDDGPPDILALSAQLRV